MRKLPKRMAAIFLIPMLTGDGFIPVNTAGLKKHDLPLVIISEQGVSAPMINVTNPFSVQDRSKEVHIYQGWLGLQGIGIIGLCSALLLSYRPSPSTTVSIALITFGATLLFRPYIKGVRLIMDSLWLRGYFRNAQFETPAFFRDFNINRIARFYSKYLKPYGLNRRSQHELQTQIANTLSLETIHVFIFLSFLISSVATPTAYEKIVKLFLGVILNLHPILLQRYNRLRLLRAISRIKTRDERLPMERAA